MFLTSMFQAATSQSNVGSNSSTPFLPSKTAAPVQSGLSESGNQSRPKQDDPTSPPTSSTPTSIPNDRQLPPNSTKGSGTSQSDVSSNGSTDPLQKNDSLSEVDRQSGDITTGCSGSTVSAENKTQLSPAPVVHQLPNPEGVRGRSSDVVAMEGMPSRYGVGPEGLVDGRYPPPNGRDGYVGRMGHPVAVEGTFRHGYQRQMEPYDRSAPFGVQAGFPCVPPPPHPGFFNHPNHPSYQYHPHGHPGHGAPYHNQAGTVVPGADTGQQMHVPVDIYGGVGRQQYPGLMTPPSSVTSSTSHPSNDCDSERGLLNGDAEGPRRGDNQTKNSENSFTESTWLILYCVTSRLTEN